MFARVSTYKMKPESIAAAEARVQELVPQILAMDGMVTFTNLIDAEGNGIVVSVVESEAQSDGNAEQVARIWSEFSDYLLGPPRSQRLPGDRARVQSGVIAVPAKAIADIVRFRVREVKARASR